MSESCEPSRLVGVTNDTKWAEVRCAMLDLPVSPWFLVKLVGYPPSYRDGEWYDHFRLDPYRDIEWVELKPRRPDARGPMLAALRAVGVAGRETENGAVIYGHVPAGEPIDYL